MAFVAPTTIRFLVLLGALISAGLFMGTWLHNVSPVGDDWARRAADCVFQRGIPGLGVEAAVDPACAAIERRRFGFALGGVCLTVAAGLGVMLVAPRVIERRRRMRPVGSRLAPALERFQALVGEAGFAVPPSLVHSATLRDGFSYGIPRRYRVAVPPAVLIRWRDGTTFDPLIRHELAHLRHHDVPLAWIARSVWLVLVPLLGLPIVWGLASGDHSLLPSYVWRSALVAAVTLLASTALLRSREHDADLRASPTPESAAELRTLLHRVSTPARRGWRKLLAYHPTAKDRLGILDRPERHAAVTFVDGLSPAFLAGLTLPLLLAVVSTISGELTFVVAAIVVGPLLGVTVGLGLWRQSFVARVTGGRVRVAPVALGVLVGYALGETVSLAQTGLGTLGPYDHLAVNAITPIAACGATVIAAGLGELFAEAAPRFRTPSVVSILCILLVGTLFAVAIWAALTLSAAVDEGGWPLGSTLLLTVLSIRWLAIAALALAAASAWALLISRSDAVTPDWAVVGEPRPPWPVPGKPRILAVLMIGIAAGAIGSFVIIGHRMLAGPPGSDAAQLARANVYMLVMATVGAACALALGTLQRGRGIGAALLATPVASVTTAIGFFAMNTALGGRLYWAFMEQFIRPSLALGLLGGIVAAVVSLLLQVPQAHALKNGLVAGAAAGLLAGVASYGVIVGEHVLLRPAQATVTPSIPRELYGQVVALPLLEGRMATASAWRALQDERPPNDVAARRIRTELLPVLRQMRDGAEATRIDDPEVRDVHAHAIAGARFHVTGFEKIASALEQDNRELLNEGDALLKEGNAEWERWAAGTDKL